MNTPARLLLTPLALASVASAAVVVDFNGYADSNAGFLTAGFNWGTSANTVRATTTLADDTVRSTVPYGTTLAANGADTYTGPTLRGGAYMNSIYSATQTDAFQSSWGQMIENVGGDYIQMRRNGGSTGNLATSTTRAVFTFDTGGSYAFDETSSLSFTGGVGSASSRFARWVVVSGGVTYISETTTSFTSNSNTVTYNLANPSAVNWAAWTPSSDLGNLPATYSIAGTLLDGITEAGFYFEKVGSTGTNPTFRQFTADLAVSNIPEPSAFAALAGLGVLALAATRRRRA